MIQKDYFGFLDYQYQIEFGEGYIEPIQDFAKIKQEVDTIANVDGFLYPPDSYLTDSEGNQLSRTEKPSWKQPVPRSHQLVFWMPEATDDLRKGNSSFLIQLLAYFFGVRLQFHDWWFDMRIPHRWTHNINFQPETVDHFLTHCYHRWKQDDFHRDGNDRLSINLLYMHSRVPSYQWDWERFLIEYMVSDACYRIAKNIYGVVEEVHKKRLRTVCKYFEIPIHDDYLEKIVALRNQLFHETLWDGTQPCSAESNIAWLMADHLRRLNQRIIPALFGYRNNYVKTGWWYMGSWHFDKYEIT